MLPRNRRKRTLVRYRRRLGWDTGTHPNLCECPDCTALYGAVHALLCRCPECVDYGAPAIIGPLTGFDLFMVSKYGGALAQVAQVAQLVTDPRAPQMLADRSALIREAIEAAGGSAAQRSDTA